MGNIICCLQSNRHIDELDQYDTVSLTSTKSITNFSWLSEEDGVLHITNKLFTSHTTSSQFSWLRLQSIYTNAINKNEELNINVPILSVIKNIINVIEGNIALMSQRIYENINESDSSFPYYFEECAKRNLKSITEGKQFIDRINNHTIAFIYFHKIIINYLEKSEIQKAYNLLKLVATSHVIINVRPGYFQYMDVVFNKFLFTNGFLQDENFEQVSIYFNVTTNYICKCMKEINDHATPNIESSDLARNNYREMKKWYAFVDEFHQTFTYQNDL